MWVVHATRCAGSTPGPANPCVVVVASAQLSWGCSPQLWSTHRLRELHGCHSTVVSRQLLADYHGR
jgi:hypothetical protein